MITGGQYSERKLYYGYAAECAVQEEVMKQTVQTIQAKKAAGRKNYDAHLL